MAGTTLPGAIGAFKWLIDALHRQEARPRGRRRAAGQDGREGAARGPAGPGGRDGDRRGRRSCARGLQMAVDGTDPDDLYDILAAEVKAKKASAAAGAGFWTDAGGYAPTIGIIGTVMGLVHVLENLVEPDKLGHLIAARVRRDAVGRALGERDVPALGQAHQGRRCRRGRPHGAHHRRRPRHPGRRQPARRRRPSSAPRCRRRAGAPPRRRRRERAAATAARSAAATRRSTRSTRTTSAGWSATPT